jgi:hypothetical protein
MDMGLGSAVAQATAETKALYERALLSALELETLKDEQQETIEEISHLVLMAEFEKAALLAAKFG